MGPLIILNCLRKLKKVGSATAEDSATAWHAVTWPDVLKEPFVRRDFHRMEVQEFSSMPAPVTDPPSHQKVTCVRATMMMD